MVSVGSGEAGSVEALPPVTAALELRTAGSSAVWSTDAVDGVLTSGIWVTRVPVRVGSGTKALLLLWSCPLMNGEDGGTADDEIGWLDVLAEDVVILGGLLGCVEISDVVGPALARDVDVSISNGADIRACATDVTKEVADLVAAVFSWEVDVSVR